MPQFIATSSKGLMDVLHKEISELGLKAQEKKPFGVLFESNWQGCYEANLKLRSATRILRPVLDFYAYNRDDLYYNTKKHDFTKYISPEETLMVDVNMSRSKSTSVEDGKSQLNVFSQNQVAMVIKDALVDEFRDKFSIRPSVDTKKPDLRVVVRVDGSLISLAIDTSGENLSQRGYRKDSVEAPLREHLAAGLLMMTDWEPTKTLVDPMCGSGTFLIEAALMAQSWPSRSLQRRYSFEGFSHFDKKIFEKLKSALPRPVSNNELSSQSQTLFFGFDKSAAAIASAKENAKRAGVLDLIRFEVKDFRQLQAGVGEEGKTCFGEGGVVIVNPPYGGRMGEVEQLKPTYRDLGRCLKNNFADWSCWVLSGEEKLTRELGLKAFQKVPVRNGNIECRFLGYSIRGFTNG